MTGSGHVVAERRWGPRTTEDRAGMTDPLGQRLSTIHHQLQVLWRNGVGYGQRLIWAVHQHAPTSISQRGRDVLPAGSLGHHSDYFGLHGLCHRLVPRNQPGQTVRAVLGLDYDIDSGEERRDRGVSHHHHLRRAGEGRRDANMARHLAFSKGHVHAARPDNDVHGGHGFRPIGHGGHRLSPSHRIHGIDFGHSSSGQSHIGDSAINSGRNAEDDLVHSGHPCGYGGHQDGGGVGSSAAGGVAARPLHRAGQGADNQTLFLGSALGSHLADVVAPDSLGRYLQCLQDSGLDAVRSGGNLSGVDADGL